MRDNWIETTLGEVAAWHSGGTPKAGKPEFYENGMIPWVVIADMLETEIFNTASRITPAGLNEIGGKLAPKDSVLISMYATVGRPGYAHLPVATNQAIAWSIPNNEIIRSRFLLLVAQRLEPTIASMARGATQKNINRAMLRDFSFMLPSLSEQKRIIDVMAAVDDYTTALRQQADDARTARNAVLHELLTAGRDDWTYTTLGDVAVIQQGQNLAISTLTTGEYPVYGANGIVGHFDRWNSDQEVVALGCRGSCGTVHSVTGKAWLANNVMAIWPKDVSQIVVSFIALVLETADLRSSGVISGQVQPQITRTSLSPLVLTFPSLAEQQGIVEIVTAMDDFIRSAEQAVANTQHLRAGLLSNLLSGEHEIPESYDRLLGAA